MNGLIRKLLKKVGMSWVTGQIRAAAEGKLGPRWKGAYWWLAGKKRMLSIVLGLAAGVALGMGHGEAAAIMGSIAAVGVSLGFIDANWRDEGDADDFKESWWWQLLANNAPVVVTVLLAAFGWTETSCDAASQHCHEIEMALGALSAGLVHIGILDAAWRAAPPSISE